MLSRRAPLLIAAFGLAGCAVAPSPAPAPVPASPTATPPIAAPVPPAPSRPPTLPIPLPPTRVTPAPAPVPPTAKVDSVARYERVSFGSLPTSADADWLNAWPALLQSCQALAPRAEWKEPCARVATVDKRSPSAIRNYFATAFDAYRVRSVTVQDGKESEALSGLVTGYYEPLLKGSRRSSSKFRVPIYRVPDDLIVVDLVGVYPELAGLRLRGKLQGNRVVPYPSRGEISASNTLRGHELMWVDDPIEAFFLHVQGSGRVQLDDGRTTRLGYAEQNGHPYRSIGRWLVDQGELTIDQASMQGIKAWAALNPQRLRELLEQNPSFVFFREVPLGDPAAGPKGALGVPLTPAASLAVDTRFIPIGAPVILSSTDPVTGAAFTRPMLAQDSGGAIRGPLRFDYFWGFGAEAGEKAGKQKFEGSAWVLTPKGVAPEALLKR